MDLFLILTSKPRGPIVGLLEDHLNLHICIIRLFFFVRHAINLQEELCFIPVGVRDYASIANNENKLLEIMAKNK